MSRSEVVTAFASSLLVNFCYSLCFCEAKLIFKSWSRVIYLVRFSFVFLSYLCISEFGRFEYTMMVCLFPPVPDERGKSSFWNLFNSWIEHSTFSANTPSPEISQFKFSITYCCCLYAKPLIMLPQIITSKWSGWQKNCHTAKDFVDLESSWEGDRIWSQEKKTPSSNFW